MTLPILILAGGASRRMGQRDKLMEKIDGTPLIRRQAQTALGVSDDVTVLLRPGNDAPREALHDLAATVIEPIDALEGIGGSLRAGTAAMADKPAFVLFLADLVELTTDDLQMVIDAKSANPNAKIWRATTQQGEPGHPIIFDEPVYPDLLMLSGDSGGQKVIKARQKDTVNVPLPGKRARIDLDTPAAWEAWRKSRK